MVNLFTFSDYKKYLLRYIEQPGAERGLISQMAEGAGCQRSYMSRVVHGDVHLTSDQAFNLTQFLRLQRDEEEYFLAMVEKDRASSKPYRDRQVEKMKTLKQKNEELRQIVKREKLSDSAHSWLYYSNWLYGVLHIIVSIPEFQTAAAIAKVLNLPVMHIEKHLEDLLQMNLISKRGQKWEFNSTELHVAHDSPQVALFHSHWRQRAVVDAQLMRTESLHYTNIQTVDQKAFDEIRSQILTLIKDAAKVAGAAPYKDVVCISCDLFKVY